MSDFDLKLGRWEKISTIVIGALGLMATAYVTIAVILPGEQRSKLKDCRAEQTRATKQINESPNIGLKTMAGHMSTICNEAYDNSMKFLTERQSSALLNKERKQETSTEQGVAAENNNSPERIEGFVSIGLDSDYQASNFRDVASDEKAIKVIKKLEVGSILQARWSVNLRESKENTESGKNKSLLVIRDEECVRLEEKPIDTTRGSWWVKVSLASCPGDRT